MAVSINIDGKEFTANNAAEDSTLRDIERAIIAQSKGGGGGGNTRGLDATNKAASRAAGGLSILGGAATNTGDSFANAGKSASNAGAAFNSASKSVISSFSGLVTQSSSTGAMLDNIGKTIGSVGSAMGSALGKLGLPGKLLGGVVTGAAAGLGLLSGVLGRNIEQFEKVSASGASFGNSLTRFRQISNQAGLSTEMLANVVQKAGENLAAFGGTTERGGMLFARSNKKVQEEYGEIMLRMGIGFTEQGSLLAGFMGDLAASGQDLSQMPTDELTKSFMTLTTQQKIMAQYNGTSLEQERQKIKAMKEDAALQAALLDLSPLQREAALKAIADADALVAGGGKALRELFITEGGGFFTAGSAAIVGELGTEAATALNKIYSDIRAGNLDVTENIKGFANSFGPEQLKNMAQIAKAGAMGATGAVVDAISGAFVTTQKTIGKEINDTFKKIQDDFATLKIPAINDLDNSAAKLAKTTKNLSTSTDKLVSGLLTSSEFDALLTGTNTLIGELEKGISKIANDPADGPNQSILDKTISLIGNGIMNYLTGASPANPTNPASTPIIRPTTPPVNSSQNGTTSGSPGEDTLGGGAGDDRLDGSAIPDDVAEAMRSTPMLLQKLTEQVRRSSEDNASKVARAIADN